MSEIVRSLSLVPSLVITLDETGQRVAGRAWERLAACSAVRRRVALLRCVEPLSSQLPLGLEPLLPEPIGPSLGRVEGGPVSRVIWETITLLNEAEPLPSLLRRSGYYARLGAPAIYYVGELGSASHPTVLSANQETPSSGRLHSLAGAVQRTLADRDLAETNRVALLHAFLPADPDERQQVYRRLSTIALDRLLAIPAEPADAPAPDIWTPPLTFCYLFGQMDQEGRSHTPEDVEGGMALALVLLLASALQDSSGYADLFRLSDIHVLRANEPRDVRRRPRLGTMGVSRLYYPRQQIIDYCAHRLALQVMLPHLVPAELTPDTPRQQREQIEWLEKQARAAAQEISSHILAETAPQLLDSVIHGKQRRLSLPRLSPLMQEIESDPARPVSAAELLEGQDPARYPLLLDPDLWLPRVEPYRSGYPQLPGWWNACAEIWKTFAAERVQEVDELADTLLSNDLAAGSVQARRLLSNLDADLEIQEGQAVQSGRQAQADWEEKVLLPWAEKMRRASGQKGEAEGEAEEKAQNILSWMQKRIRIRYSLMPQRMAVVALASMVFPLGVYVLEALLPLPGRPWWVQASAYALPLALFFLVWLSIYTLARYNLRRAGRDYILLLRGLRVRQIEQEDQRQRIHALATTRTQIKARRNQLEMLVSHLRHELSDRCDKACQDYMDWPHRPGRDIAAIQGHDFRGKYDLVAAARQREGNADEMLVRRFHERLRGLKLLQEPLDRFDELIIQECLQECRRHLEQDTLASFRPADPARLYEDMYDLATPLLQSLSYAQEEQPGRQTLTFADGTLHDHPLVRESRERGQIDPVSIPDRDGIALLRFTAGIWPRLLERVPWEHDQEER